MYPSLDALSPIARYALVSQNFQVLAQTLVTRLKGLRDYWLMVSLYEAPAKDNHTRIALRVLVC